MQTTLLLIALLFTNSLKAQLLPQKSQLSFDTIPVFESSGNRILKPALAVGYAGLTYLVYKFGDSEIQEEFQEHKGKKSSSLSSLVQPLGQSKINIVGLGGAALLSILSKDKKLQKTAIIWVGGMGINDFFTNQLKVSFQRHRPSTNSPYNTFDWRRGPQENKSFVSAHSSNVFTTATVFASMYKDKKWVPVVSYGIASLTALSRIHDNAHWASDVMAGALVGFLSAKGALRLYNGAEKKWRFIPQISTGYSSIRLVHNFNARRHVFNPPR